MPGAPAGHVETWVSAVLCHCPLHVALGTSLMLPVAPPATRIRKLPALAQRRSPSISQAKLSFPEVPALAPACLPPSLAPSHERRSRGARPPQPACLAEARCQQALPRATLVTGASSPPSSSSLAGPMGLIMGFGVLGVSQLPAQGNGPLTSTQFPALSLLCRVLLGC